MDREKHLRNKCFARKRCQYFPLLKQSGTCDKQYVGQTWRTILQGFFKTVEKLKQQDKDTVGKHYSADDHNTENLIISGLACTHSDDQRAQWDHSQFVRKFHQADQSEVI